MLPALIDESFGYRGGVSIRVPGFSATDVFTTKQGRTLVTGFSLVAGGGYLATVVALRNDGRLDNTWGAGGQLHLAHFETKGRGRFAVFPNGTVATIGCGSDLSKCLRHYVDAEGKRLVSEEVGLVHGKGGRQDSALKAVLIANNAYGASLAVGTVVGTGGLRLRTIRTTPDGARDRTFGDDGLVDTELPAQEFTLSRAVLYDDGSVAILGMLRSTSSSLGAALFYDRSGALDGSIGGRGTVATDFGLQAGMVLNGCAIGSRRTLLVGTASTAAAALPAFAIIEPARSTTTNTSTTTMGDGHRIGGHWAAATLDRQGRVLLAGRISHPRHSGAAVCRLSQDLSVDRCFGLNGWLPLSGLSDQCAATSVDIDVGNRPLILVSHPASHGGATVIRLRGDTTTQRQTIVRLKSAKELRDQVEVLRDKVDHDHQMAVNITRGIT